MSDIKRNYIAIIGRREEKSAWEFSDFEEMERIHFDSPSLQAAKARATKAVNVKVFGQDWDGNPKTGKGERWRKWTAPYDVQNNDKLQFTYKVSDTTLWHFDEEKTLVKYKLYVYLYYEKEKE